MQSPSSNLRYNINLRRKEAICHSILDVQSDIKDITISVETYSETLNNLLSLQHPVAKSLLAEINHALAAVNAKLDRSIDITLAHSEEVLPTTIPTALVDEEDTINLHHTFPQDRLYLLPLKIESLEDPDLGDLNHILNPSEYLLGDEEFARTTSFVDCCLEHEPTVYIHGTESIHDVLFPNFTSPFKAPTDLNKFYCALPPPNDAPPNCPDKGNALDRCGNPFYKRLQINDCVYSPSRREFARVFSWSESEVNVEVISAYRSYTELFIDPSSFARFPCNYNFGDFVIALNHLQDRKFLAYVSPYSRTDSHPFPSTNPFPPVTNTFTPASLAKKKENNKRKLK